ncbi:hypothetical protein AR689_15145 [Arthrobacter sp. EpRS71]|nr:hypothetical protein [Arthrobacter sp. EpRS71]KUM35367.1 hypothetical protein AR689_15145 [Arthrobacter sp. EpRS71]
MPSWIRIALVDDIPDVVWVFQHLVQLAGRNGPFGESGCPAVGQANIRHRCFQLLDRISPGSVQFKGFEDERCPCFVQPNTVDHPPVDVLADVEIPEPSLAQRAAIDCFVAHLDANVFTAQLVLHLVHGVSDCFHCFGVGTLTKVLTCR